LTYRQNQHDSSADKCSVAEVPGTGETSGNKRNDGSDGNFKHVGEHIVASSKHLNGAQESTQRGGSKGVDEGADLSVALREGKLKTYPENPTTQMKEDAIPPIIRVCHHE
jgi:hypothetical protein